MRAVLAEVTAPPPVPFPWLRLMVGVGFCAGLVAIGVVVALVQGLPEPPSVEPSSMSLNPQTALVVGAPLATILLSLIAVRLSLRAMR
jgi:hypothetical protein